MTEQSRIKQGLVDIEKPVQFSFNGKRLHGFEGDTLASALLANEQYFVARSFKYHRPRGIFSAGSEEPNALIEIGKGAFKEPNVRATVAELYDGMEANSQNHRGPLKYDFMAFNDLLSNFLTAGFYYKTFMWPKAFWEKIYEPIIRSSAGLGALSGDEDPDNYDKGYLHCDILIIGSGPSGLSAALTAARSGADIILADEDFEFGGRLNSEILEIDKETCSDWAKKTVKELASIKNVRLMKRTTIYGAYDHGIYGALERKTDHLKENGRKPRQVLWRIYSKRAILAAGSTERPIAFGNNDRPNIMLAGAARTYVNRYGVAPGKAVSVFTNNNDGWKTAMDLSECGVNLAAIIDTREITPPVTLSGTMIITGGRIKDTKGRHQIRSIQLENGQEIKTDCLAVSGGWNPNVHLTCHKRSKPIWSPNINAFIPGKNLPVGMIETGAANGKLSLSECLIDGHQTANIALKALGYKPTKSSLPKAQKEQVNQEPFWHVASSKKRAWVDLQNDVTAKDIALSHQEGFSSVEHLKRYTTLGMATDQGKTSNIAGLAILAEVTGKSIEETGTTIFRPPYTPVPIGAFAGRSRGKNFKPIRKTPSHKWAEENGATFIEVGQWLRAQWFTRKGETHWRQSVDREVLQTRKSVGICDVTTLGKIDIQGKDAAEFLNKVYANAFGKLPVGKVRYGLMLREDGIVMDDGTTARLSETHFVMTTTTANAANVFRHLEFCRQCLWPEMYVHLISVTDQWAQFAVAGPNSRKLLQKVIGKNLNISNEAFPFMACTEFKLFNNIPARLFRISFSGELAYEVAVPSRYGDALIRKLMEVGKTFDVVAYGTESLSVMRIEKGHPVGNELNGQTTARDLGMGKMVSKKKDSIGSILSERPHLNREDGLALVGLQPIDKDHMIPAGAHFLEKGAEANMENDQGWITSVAYSPNLGHSIALGFVKRGNERLGETIIAADPLRKNAVEVELVSPHFIDPEGERLRG